MNPEARARRQLWQARLRARRGRLRRPPPLVVEGRLSRMVGLTLEAVGCEAPIGARCRVSAGQGEIEAEVVGFADGRVYLMPTGPVHGLLPSARVIPAGTLHQAAVGEGLLGRVLDGAGKPLDGRGPLDTPARLPLTGRPINPLARDVIREPLDVGIRAINALLTVGRGQRVGLFAGSGVGKSVLLGMMTRHTRAQVIVVGLIGERGREVKEFIEKILGQQGLARAVVVVTPADSPPLQRLHGAWLATTIAEYFRDQGRDVLLLMDSLTRFAQAQREIALAIGEPPATRGYPPSVFARLPQLVERAGKGPPGGGSITAFYTVLTEGDDQQDPVADAARAILDGHIVLSRWFAEAGHYPAIDIEASVSRCMSDVAAADHLEAVRRFRALNAAYQQNRDLINIGAYVPGGDPRLDEAVSRYPAMSAFLQQGMDEPVSLADSITALEQLMATEQTS
ncbi:MAG TPA: flagellar protein export ATPase FliI [Gammaproteobacteria bacterium]|nr:flagellar protein export ATPase FliI [Gammaproteobacteria bacterium]